MIKILLFVLLLGGADLTCAQPKEAQLDSGMVVSNSFWDNWYAQVGADMNLTFLKDHSIKDVFPNGKSIGINAAVGKWFSPEFGLRIKATWNNGIFKNDHNTWLRPYGEPGENHRKGGFVTILGDVQINLHNLIGIYHPKRKWNIIGALRGGAYFDIGSGAGAPVLGVGIINTYRLGNRWRLFADAGYHFVSSINGVASGKGHGGNSFAEISLGVEMDISKNNSFQHTSESKYSKATIINSIWDNWFIQTGVGMSLINPYGTNFANVFPNGSTWGVNFGLGKWFTSDIGLRGGLNWQNGIIGNRHTSYLDYEDSPGSNADNHGYVSVYADVIFNLNNMITGYDDSRRWNTIAYPRLGLVKNFSSEYEEGPILGAGIEQTYTINEKWKLYADINYQATTGSFLDGKFETGSTGSTGWLDLNIGIQYELGMVRGWKKPQSAYTHSAPMAATGHNWPRFVVNTIGSVGVAYIGKTALKAMIKEERPDHSDNKSFPSGHASMAFAAARSIDKEFRKDCIWIPIAGYAAATAVGIERIANKHHHWYDVVAGAAVGYGAAELTWWLSDLMFGKGSNIAVGTSGNTLDVTYNF